MTNIRIAHLADIHWCRQYKDKAAASLRSAIATAKERGIDLWALAGDIFDQVVQNSERDAFPELLGLISEMLDIAPIVAVRGTPSHDTPGSYDALSRLRGAHGFLVLDPGTAYCLADSGLVCPIYEATNPRLLILGCGEPSKEWWLADKTGLGREEAAQAVVDGMRALLLGLGAIRREHAELPTLVAYHGQIVGATLASGQALRKGGIQIGREDLALIDPAMVARYCGAVYPTDWGERHQTSWCLVEISGVGTYGALGDIHMPQEIINGGAPVSVELVPFPHAPRRKIVLAPWDGNGGAWPRDVAGQQVWLVIKGPKDKLAIDSVDDRMRTLEADGALPGSRVTLEEIPTETVRAGDIQEAASLGDKLRIYAENSGEQIPPGTAGKVEQLEAEARAEGSAPAGQHIRIDSLKLRGAIGVYKGQGVDDIDLDLSRYDDGLIALLGPNGCLAGSTLIDVPRDLSKHPAGIPIRDLVGTEPLVYSYDGQRIALARATNVRRTGIQRQVYRVRFTSRSKGRFATPLELVGTAEHPVMLRDGSYKPLGDLRRGDRLMPLYRRSRDGKYAWIDRNDGSFTLEHRMVAASVAGRPLGDDEHAHHIDHNPINNGEENIAGMVAAAHLALHGGERPPHYDEHPRGMLGKRHTDVVADGIRRSMRRHWADPSGRAMHTEAIQKNGLERRLPMPSAEHLRQLYEEDGLSTTAIGVSFGVSDPTAANWLRRRGIGVRAPGRRKKSNHRVLSVDPAGCEDVYDIEVPSHHCFVANGVVVHNSGKTTLIENLHPFPGMLTRDGKLQDHYRLRDSYRDLTWTDARTGDVYRALVAIDAQAACDYHLYRNGEPLVNGRKADYEARIGELFGSLPLYLRSAFVTQRATRGAPELSEATKGERKALFRELGGLDYLQAYADRAKAHRQEHETALIADQREIEILTRDIDGTADLPAQLETRRASLEAARQRVAAVETEGKDAREASDKAQARLTRHQGAEVELNGLRNQVVVGGRERADLEQRIIACRRAEEQCPELQRQIANYETIKAEEEAQHAKRTDVLLERERLTTQHGRAVEAHRTEQRKIESRQHELKDQASTLTREKVREMAAVDALLARLATVTCPHCGGKFTLGGETEKAAVEEKQQRVLDLDCDLVLNEKHAKDAAAELTALGEPPATPVLPVYDETPLEAVQAELERYNIRTLRAALDQAATAGVQIAGFEARIQTIGQDLIGLQVRIAAAEGRLDPEAVAEQAAAQKRVDDLTATWRKAHGEATALEAEVKALEAQIAEVERKRAALAETRERVAGRQAEVAAWRWLERATGPDGIQALELDAMGPGIAAVANRILEAAYGARFSIEFRTARLSGSGARAKQVEDFQIIVHDSERGGEQPIETLSGGESVWVKRALYDAFGIIRDRATGQRFLTVFQDEADGALDPEARIAYVRMLEAAHVESGRRHTILITHSETVQQMVEQRIDMRELARQAVTA